MKVVRNTPDQLILKSTPWLLGLMFSGGILVSIGFGFKAIAASDWTEAFWAFIGIPAFLSIFLVAFVRRDDVILDRSRDMLEMRHATFLGRRKVQHRLSDLARATVQSSYADGSTTHRVALVLDSGMDAGTHPVTSVYSGGNGARRTADLINAWLARPVDSDPPQA